MNDITIIDQAPAALLTPDLEALARAYIAERRRNGESLLAMANAVAAAREAAQHGAWGVWLAAVQLNERAARRLLAIYERAANSPAFAEAVKQNWFNATTAALVAESDDESLLTRLLALPAPPTRATVAALANPAPVPDLAPAAAPPPPSAERAALIARAVAMGLNIEDQGDEGLLVWWPDEERERLLPLSWEDVDGWLLCYREQGPPDETPHAVAATEVPPPDPVLALSYQQQAERLLVAPTPPTPGYRIEADGAVYDDDAFEQVAVLIDDMNDAMTAGNRAAFIRICLTLLEIGTHDAFSADEVAEAISQVLRDEDTPTTAATIDAFLKAIGVALKENE